MKLATLRCNVWTGPGLVGFRCLWNAQPGTRRCGLHRILPAEALRCRFEYAGGQRCSRHVRIEGEQRYSYCRDADHRRACPGGCDGWTPWHDRPCRSCQTAQRQQQRATCTLEVDDGVLCGAQIKDDAPDLDRCKRHPRRKVHAWGRCQRLYISGRRCHRSVRNAHAEVCPKHVTFCVVCGGTTDRADPTTARCKKHLVRCTEEGCEGFPLAGGGCFRHPTGGVQGACIAWSVWSDAPCTNTDTNDEGLCSKHANPPADEDRCAVITPRGRCWNRRDPLALEDGRCAGHRVGRAWTAGPRPAYQPVAAPQCVGMTIVGERCSRHQQDGGPWCTVHAAIAALPEEDRCRATVDADGKAWPCVIRPRGAHRLCVRHLQTHDKAGCDQLVGEGRSCEQPAAHDTRRCAFHAHEIEPDDHARCAHTYVTGQRCWHDPIGGADLCSQHTQACVVEGCPTGVAVVGADRCRDHRPSCNAWTAKGTRCERAARSGIDRCGLHPADAGGCAHIHPDGSKCVWTPAGYSDLCATHRIACTAAGCTTRTAMADGLCRDHRPICGTDGCGLPIYQGHDCFVHARLREQGTCALLTRKDEHCGRPATVDTPNDGRICATHATIMPPDDLRCLHIHASGQRCAAHRETGRAWCHDHSGANNRTCPGLTRLGEPCEAPVAHTEDDTGIWCWTHIPAETDRCQHQEDGWRCPLQRRERYATCRWHAASNPRCDGSIFGDCDLPALLDQTWCWTHDPADDADRCRHEANGWRCYRERRRFEPNCTEHRPYAPRCWAAPDGLACHGVAVVDTRTCWKHYGWEEGQMEDHDDDWRRFHGQQHEELLAEIEEVLAIEALNLDRGDVTPPTYDEASFITEGGAMMAAEQEVGVPWDPYDLLGGRAVYDDAIRDGRTHEEALHAARMYQYGADEKSIQGHTAKLREYLEFCDQRALQAIPATQVSISMFISHLSERGSLRDGTPLGSNYVKSFMGSIAKLHKARGLDNPFDTYPQLETLARAVTRLYSKPQVRAHAIRADELSRMVDLCLRAAEPDPRDVVLALLLTTPETAGLSFVNLAGLTWEDVHLPAEGTGADGAIDYRFRNSSRQVVLPNIVDTIDHRLVPPGETLAVERVCLVSAFRRLHMRIVNDHAAGRPIGEVRVNRDGSLSGPVFLNSDGRTVGKTFGPKILDPICDRLGLGRITECRRSNLDVRLRILDALEDVDFVALRDAAILVSMFWVSLRVSEAARLTVGDIWWDAQNRGAYVRVKRGKGDYQSHTTPVRKAHRNGRPIIIDFRSVIERYWVAYAERLGRDLQVGDPMFIATQGMNTGEAITRQAINNVVKKRAAAAGVRAEFDERISSHGLRAGFATEQLYAGMSAEEVAYLQRRQTTASVYGYFRPAPFDDRPRGTIFTGPEDAFDLQTAEDIIREI